MKKLGFAVAALGAIVIAAPTIASAETVVIKRGHHHDWRGARAEYRMHRDWHRDYRPFHRDHDRTVIIKHRHEY
ncbi:hypothetical protein ACQR1W_36795 [Bradyrhizobium sp. HKCCYLS1011]|uniref:hypothetical protein n=1 Tax=Bradyrhizobium sp. HKCCYLS1011 TaxID=3420733 RepID=UPI003EBD5AEB